MASMWYYIHEGRQYGPVSGAEIKKLAAGGQLLPTDLVWKDGMPEMGTCQPDQGGYSHLWLRTTRRRHSRRIRSNPQVSRLVKFHNCCRGRTPPRHYRRSLL